MSMEHLEKGIQETPGNELFHDSRGMDAFDNRAEICPREADTQSEPNRFDPDARVDVFRQELQQTEGSRAEVRQEDTAPKGEGEAFDPDARAMPGAEARTNSDSPDTVPEAARDDEEVTESSGTESAEGKQYYDDNGILYRIDNNLLPNNAYDINGYHYKTDDHGRTISAEGQLKLRDPDFKRDMEPMETVGRGNQKADDDRGHEVGYQFGGSGGIENVVAMNREVNQKLYAPIENRLADAIRDGAKAYLKIESKYEGDSFRPTEFKITTTVDGEKTVYNFKNESGGAK